MARKDRAPDPPKRPQGPKRRTTPSGPKDAERRRRLLYLVGGAGIAALAVALAFVFLAGGGENEREVLEAAGCTLEVVPAQVGEHTAELAATSDPKWNTDPPTSGPHNEQSAVWGSYEDPIPFAQSIHNLEHGGIVIHYGDEVPEAEVDAIRAFYADDPRGMLVAPLAKLGDQIALSAWTSEEAVLGESGNQGQGFLAKCPRFDEDAFSTFVDEHRFKGPERVPPELLTPGS